MSILNPIQDPDYRLFKYSGDLSQKIEPEVRIEIEDLVRTGFKDKYNELAQSVIYNIYSKFTQGTSGQQSLVFETSKGDFEIAIVGAGVVQGIGTITADSVVYNGVDLEGNSTTNVQQALDSLLYRIPTVSAISGGWTSTLTEVGTAPINSNAAVSGNRIVKNLLSVTLRLRANATNGTILTSATQTPSPASQTPVTATLTLATLNSFINTAIPGTYYLTSEVLDTNVPANKGVSVTSNKILQIVYPIFTGSGTYNATADSILNNQVQFNNLINIPALTTLVKTKPAFEVVTHSNAQFTYFLYPQSYGLITRIEDGTTSLAYPFDITNTINPVTSSEWIIRSLNLTRSFSGIWTNIPYYLVVSKVAKPGLTLRYVF